MELEVPGPLLFKTSGNSALGICMVSGIPVQFVRALIILLISANGALFCSSQFWGFVGRAPCLVAGRTDLWGVLPTWVWVSHTSP